MSEAAKKDCFGLMALNDFRKNSGFTCSFMIFAALNIAMMIIGVQNLHNCPISYMIPVYLIVAGTTSLLLLFGRLLLSHVIIPQLMTDNRVGAANEESNIAKQGNSEGDKKNLSLALYKLIKVFDSLASIFSTCWMIVGSVYVYGKFSQVSYDEYTSDSEEVTEANPLVHNPNYCDSTTLIFAFTVITIGYISLGFSILLALITCFWTGTDPEDD